MDVSDNIDLFRLALSAHRKAGHDAGYARAVADMLASSVFVAEGVLREAASPEARALLYRFVAALESETRRRSTTTDEVSDGLGI